MSELLTVKDVIDFAKDTGHGGMSQLIMDAVHIERERCLGHAMRSDPPYSNDLVRSGAWHSCAYHIEQKIRSGE